MMNRRNFSKYLLLTAVKSFFLEQDDEQQELRVPDKKKMIENTWKE